MTTMTTMIKVRNSNPSYGDSGPEDKIRSNVELKRDRESIASAMRGEQTDPLIEWIDAIIAGDESHRDRAERALDKLATEAE
jgi:hypothetical protein